MTARHLIALLAISLLSIVEAKAASTPFQLRGKTVTLSWSETGAFKSADGSPRTVTYNLVRVVYISQAGRAFVRGTTTGRKASMTKEAGPERTARAVTFNGNSIVVFQVNLGIARRVIVTFDPAFSSCSVSLTVGKSGPGASLEGADGVIYQVISIVPSAVTCSIREGNALAD